MSPHELTVICTWILGCAILAIFGVAAWLVSLTHRLRPPHPPRRLK